MTKSEAYGSFLKANARAIATGDYAVESPLTQNVLVVHKKAVALAYLELKENGESEETTIPFADVQEVKYFREVPTEEKYASVTHPKTLLIRTENRLYQLRISQYDFDKLSNYYKHTQKKTSSAKTPASE